MRWHLPRLRLITLGFTLLLPGAASILAAAPASRTGLATPELTGARQYLVGMSALEKGEYTQAAAAISQALEADPDNEEYVRARGVA
jgi:Tfp pilus assembly protein PilF